MDRNSTGTIDWWEFVNYEAVKVLGRRDKVSYYTTNFSVSFMRTGKVLSGISRSLIKQHFSWKQYCMSNTFFMGES